MCMCTTHYNNNSHILTFPFDGTYLGGKLNLCKWPHTDRGTGHVLAKDSGTYHVRVNLWSALYKLTGWLASLVFQIAQTSFN